MKCNELGESVHDQAISQVDHDSENENINETDSQLFRASADFYERRWKNRIKDHQGEWWIAIAIYLIFVSIAFVAL